MLPGKKYTPEDVLRIARKRFWLIAVPFAFVCAGAAVYAWTLPDLYRSETTIMIVPPRIPDSVVRNIIPTRIEDRLPSIRQQILSRTRLETVIQELNLYAEMRRTGIMEDVVEEMRRNIFLVPSQGNTFTVRYVGQNPVEVMRVAERLGQTFINEGLRYRESLTTGTTNFLETQLNEARTRLQEHEQKVEAYRRQFAGELPEQLSSNLQATQNVQMQIQSLLQSVSRGQERRLLIEKQLAEAESQVIEPVQVDALPAGGGSTLQQLAAHRASLAGLELRLTPQHPDIVRLRQVIAELETKAEAEALRQPLSTAGAPPMHPAEAARQRRIADLRSELAQLTKEIDRQLAEEVRLRGIAQRYQQRAEAAPTRQTEMIELMRDYNQHQATYGALLSKREQARLSADLEANQIGEQFTLLDPARVPQRPFSPNRLRIGQMSAIAGLALGVALVGLLEYRDRSLKTEDDVKATVSLPVLAVVPLMASPAEKRRAFRFRLLRGAVFGSVVMACLAVYVRVFLW
jgi:polysaccharide chain length determinant protein (PEP-CTERM system associated)